MFFCEVGSGRRDKDSEWAVLQKPNVEALGQLWQCVGIVTTCNSFHSHGCVHTYIHAHMQVKK